MTEEKEISEELHEGIVRGIIAFFSFVIGLLLGLISRSLG